MDIRRAAVSDAELLRVWRNEPEARRMFRNPAIVDHDSHVAWFKRCLADENVVMLLAIVNEKPVGTIRFDRRPENAALVSINIAAKHRHRGIGRELLQLGCQHAEEIGFARTFHAEIKADNVASRRLFESLGFVWVSRDEGWDAYLRSSPAVTGER